MSEKSSGVTRRYTVEWRDSYRRSYEGCCNVIITGTEADHRRLGEDPSRHEELLFRCGIEAPGYWNRRSSGVVSVAWVSDRGDDGSMLGGFPAYRIAITEDGKEVWLNNPFREGQA